MKNTKNVLRRIALLTALLIALPVLCCSAMADTADILLVTINTSQLYVVLGGESRQLTARIFPQRESGARIYWMSDNEAVATVDSNGVVTAHSLGKATITAQASHLQEATCEVIVTDNPATTMSIAQTSITLEERTAYALEWSVGPATADTLDVEWSSSNKSVAVVNSNGKVFGKSAGTCWITATPKCGGAVVARCQVTVTPSDKPMKYVVLTFDDGPDRRTPELLDLLDLYDIPVTFFCQGARIEQFPGIACRAYESGHEIANHTYSHETLTKLSLEEAKAQIDRADAAIQAATGEPSKVCRAPGGSISTKVAQYIGKPFIHWTVDTNDWKYPEVEHVWTFIAKHTENYDVVLMHDIHTTTIKAMYKAIPYLLEQGFTPITVSELLEQLEWNDPSLIYRPN